MTTRTLQTGYRIGPMPAIRTSRSRPAILAAAAIGIAAVGLLIALVVVLNKGVERGQQLRAAMTAAPANAPKRPAAAARRTAPIPAQAAATPR